MPPVRPVGNPGGGAQVQVEYGCPGIGQLHILKPVESIPHGTQQSVVHGRPLATVAVVTVQLPLPAGGGCESGFG